MLGDIINHGHIDLRLSTWDKETSEPHKGRFNWIKKVLVSYQSPDRPSVYLKWQKDNQLYLSKERAEMGYEPVIAPTKPEQKDPVKDGFDPFFAEGSEITADGKYRYGDLILCKCPLDKELSRRENIEKMSSSAAKDRVEVFQTELEKYKSAVPDEVVKRLRGQG
jgi:hypothetical protein